MTDKVQEIRKALEAVTPGPWELGPGCVFVPNEIPSKRKPICVRPNDDDNAHLIANAPSWLSYLLTELDLADKIIEFRNLQIEDYQLVSSGKYEMLYEEKERLEQEANHYNMQSQIIQEHLDAAKASRNEYFDMLDNLSKQLDTAKLKIEQLEGQKAFAFRERDDIRNINFKFARRHEDMKQLLKQAIHPLKEAHRLLELHRTAEAHATLTAAVNTVVEQVEKENTHEK